MRLLRAASAWRSQAVERRSRRPSRTRERRLAGLDRHRQQARPAHLDALDDLERRRRDDLAPLAQVRAERGRGGAGRRILDHAADRERVTRPESAGGLAPDELERRQVMGEHQRLHRLERVVERRQARPVARGEDQVLRARRTRRRAATPDQGRRARQPSRSSADARRPGSGSRTHVATEVSVARVRPSASVVGRDRDRAAVRLEDEDRPRRRAPQARRAARVGQGDAARDRGVAAERDLGERAEVADPETSRASPSSAGTRNAVSE